jgi:hypothetical protein
MQIKMKKSRHFWRTLSIIAALLQHSSTLLLSLGFSPGAAY